jgi:hypothetical protein
MGNKIRCKFCKFEEQSKCSVKKGTTVKRNKKRTCLDYQMDEDKVLNFLDSKQSIKTTMRPDWLWSRKDRKAARDKAIKAEMNQYQTTAAPDSKHPLTGDLSRFSKPAPQETIDGQ